MFCVGVDKISPDQGVGLEFEFRGKKYITLPRSNFNVGVQVTTFEGFCAGAHHLYASLHYMNLCCTEKGAEPNKNNTFYVSCQPEKSHGGRIDVAGIAKEDIYEIGFDGEEYIDTHKGNLTGRFETIENLIEAVEQTFLEVFEGEPWKLCEDCSETSWDVYKEELLEMYSK